MNYNPSIHTLSNGVTVILDPMELETTNVKVHFNTGSRDETPQEQGITHFCEHMLCKGTPRFPNKKAIDDYMDYWGGTRNAATGNYTLEFFGRILGENVDKLIDFIGDTLQNSLFDPQRIELERTVICDELRRAQDNPDRQFSDFISKTLFNYATASMRTLGSIENIMSFSRDQMLEFISRRLSATNCIICVSGRIMDTDAVLSQLESTFAFLPTHIVPENTEILYSPSIAHYSKSDNSNVKLRIGFPQLYQETFENRYNNMCLSRFERHLTKKLMNVLRQDNGLVYGFGAWGVGNEKFCINGFSTQTSAQNLERVVALIAQNCYNTYNNLDITPETIDRYNRKDRLEDADWLESAGRRADHLIYFYRNFGRLYDYATSIDMRNRVTVSDVIEKSRGYFDGAMSIMTYGADFNADLASVWRDNFK